MTTDEGLENEAVEPTFAEKFWYALFDERQLRLIANCEAYAFNDPAGLPGHNLMMIIAKFDEVLGVLAGEVSEDRLREIAWEMYGEAI